MKTYWRENKDGKRVKVDSDPENDYQDGYNSGRRFQGKPYWVLPLLLLMLALFLLSLYFLMQGVQTGSQEQPQTPSQVQPQSQPTEKLPETGV